MFKRNIFGQVIVGKEIIIRFLGLISFPRFRWYYNSVIKGAEIFCDLQDRNVLIVSNHQTYFLDVAYMHHVIHSSLRGMPNVIRFPGLFYRIKSNIYIVAAAETMKDGWFAKLLSYAGIIPIKRTWREKGKDVTRKVDLKDFDKIGNALKDGWVITFPQGTTKPFSPIRRGTAHIIKEYKPLIIPVVVDGLRRGFDKKGIKPIKKHIDLKMTVKPPLEIDYDDDVNVIIAQIADAIEQSDEHNVIKRIKSEKAETKS